MKSIQYLIGIFLGFTCGATYEAGVVTIEALVTLILSLVLIVYAFAST